MPRNKKLCPSEQHVEMITFCAWHAEKWWKMLKVDAIRSRICSLGASIICSACSKRLTDKNISIPFSFFFLNSVSSSIASAVAASAFCSFFFLYRCATDKNAFHSLLLGFIPRTCYCPLSNKYISCYLFINMDGVFRQTNSWYVVIYRVLSCCMSLSFLFFVGLFFSCWLSLRQSFLDIYSFQIGTAAIHTMKYLTTN